MITRTLDEKDGIIFVEGSGRWSRWEVARHYRALRAMIAPRRAAGRSIRVLSDVTNAPRQTPAIEKRILRQIAKTFVAGDRVAVVTHDIPDRDHVRTQLRGAEFAAFSSRTAAEIWLCLDVGKHLND